MYDLLIMLKPGAKFSRDEMLSVAYSVAQSGTGTVGIWGDAIRIEDGAAYLQLEFSNEPHVAEESQEIAESFGIGCAGCTSRYEMSGNDPELDLMNDQILLCERLEETGRFILFDPAAGTLFGE